LAGCGLLLADLLFKAPPSSSEKRRDVARGTDSDSRLPGT